MKFEDDKYTLRPPWDLEDRIWLRPPWDLQDGIWVRNRKERMAEAIFSLGTGVEVNLNEKNLLCAWFPTIYLAELGVINSFLLQFKSSNNCDVKGVVNGPQLPESGKIFLNLMEMVDAFYDMGWWVGQITQNLTEEKYLVRLKFTKQVKECSPSDLRPHMEWTDSGWVTETNGTWADCFQRMAEAIFSLGTADSELKGGAERELQLDDGDAGDAGGDIDTRGAGDAGCDGHDGDAGDAGGAGGDIDTGHAGDTGDAGDAGDVDPDKKVDVFRVVEAELQYFVNEIDLIHFNSGQELKDGIEALLLQESARLHETSNTPLISKFTFMYSAINGDEWIELPIDEMDWVDFAACTPYLRLRCAS
ncbi:uncharacterized protein LOC117613312 isoform X2 [Prunus dulcis]|uniref:uncharacterized protein LOC117613312 isoform X2 n=1 Tax=Prunus dulcis TaxID=3755 RepID=UPI00148363B3|nr:uncharacterized protein LOC117613312 isoform X2 [Prunus dulcis]